MKFRFENVTYHWKLLKRAKLVDDVFLLINFWSTNHKRSIQKLSLLLGEFCTIQVDSDCPIGTLPWLSWHGTLCSSSFTVLQQQKPSK
jgi:hypothetical protein